MISSNDALQARDFETGDRPAQAGPGRGWAAREGLLPLLPWAVPLLLLVLWQVLSQSGRLPARILPAPVDIVRAGVDLAVNQHLAHDLAVSTGRALLGFVIGGSLGFALGLMTGTFATGERLLDSSIQMLRTIPHLALIPLVIVWFGIGESAKVFLVALGVFFPVYLNTYHGIRSVDPGLIEMGNVYGLSTWELFRKIIVPGALPSILVGVRYALGIMWLTLIVAETIAANSGLGYLTMNAREFMRTDVMVVGILLYAVLGKLVDSLARLLERRLLPWHPSYQRAAQPRGR